MGTPGRSTPPFEVRAVFEDVDGNAVVESGRSEEAPKALKPNALISLGFFNEFLALLAALFAPLFVVLFVAFVTGPLRGAACCWGEVALGERSGAPDSPAPREPAEVRRC